MSALWRSSVWLSLALLSACASAPPKPAAPPKPPPVAPVEHSSIQAVLTHRGELSLTDDQVKQLEALDAQLTQADAGLREQLAARKKAPEASAAPSASGPPPGGGGGRGMGMGGHGGGRGVGGGRHGGGNPEHAQHQAQTLEQQLDDNDTRYFLQVERVLTGAQYEQAQDIAERYREQLYDYRASQQQPAPAP